MSVISLADRLEAYVSEYLTEVAPDDTEVVFTTAITQRAGECEHGDLFFETVLWLTLWANPHDQTRQSYSVSGFIPVELVLDGDMQPVDLLLTEVWNKVCFGSIMAEIDADLEQVLDDNGG